LACVVVLGAACALGVVCGELAAALFWADVAPLSAARLRAAEVCTQGVGRAAGTHRSTQALNLSA
jgi:hypothetical protein